MASADPNLFATLHLLFASSQHHPKPKHRHKHPRSLLSKRLKHPTLPFLYLKPGALARLRDAQRSARSSPSRLAKKSFGSADDDRSSRLGSTGERSGSVPDRMAGWFTPGASVRVFGPLCPQRKKLLAPKASPPAYIPVPGDRPPVTAEIVSTASTNSMLESLSLELLVQIVCHLHHDQLKPAFHVSKKLRQAVIIARECHFDFTTPSRGQPNREQVSTIKSSLEWPFARDHKIGVGPSTPKAPRPAPKPLQARLSLEDMQHLAVPLFRGSASRLHRVKLPNPPEVDHRAAAPHRALFSEEELCQAVAQNSI